MRGVVLFLALTIGLVAKAQQINIKTSIYFDTDSFSLINEHYPKLLRFIDTAKKLDIKGILVRGNTDADADSMYNIRLSAKRSNSVKKYLLQNGIIDSLIHIDYYGENKPIADNNSDNGKQKNRRVDVILSAYLPKTTTTKVDSISLEDHIIQKDTCDKDTTYTSPAGTIVVMNLCDFLAQKNCFTIVEYFTPESIQAAGLRTESNTGELLKSGGMINIKTCNNKCLPRPAKIRIPIDEKLLPKDYKQMALYSNSANGWERDKGENSEVKIIKIGKQKYFEFTIQCPGMKNLDMPIWEGCGNSHYGGRKYKIKLPKGYKLIESQISGYNELWLSSLDFEKGKRKSKTCFFCGKLDKNLTLYIKAVNANGDTLIVNFKPIKDLKFRYRLFPGRCAKPLKFQCGNFLQVFGYRKSKFKIREKDFDEIISK